MTKGRIATRETLRSTVAIIELVRGGRARSRTEIIERTGLSRAIVTQRVGDLLDVGLLSESVAPSTGGRPPRQLEFRADAGHVLVADIGATAVTVAAADLAGRILGRRTESLLVSSGPQAVLGRVEAMFADVVTDTAPQGRIWGLGIGVPGPVEFRTGHPISPPIMPGWDRYPVREYFAERHGAPVWVDNDVNIMALGEYRAGVARNHPDSVFVKVGTGIGSGVICAGRVHRGAQGSAGDVGHIRVVEETDVVCRCGRVGCLEALAGGAALARDGEALAQSGASAPLVTILAEKGSIASEDVRLAARHGDAASLDLLVQSGRRVGGMLAGIVNFFNPSLVVIGGSVARAGDVYLAAIREVVYARSTPLATRDLGIQLSTLRSRAGVTGAAAMVLDQLFSLEYMGRWIDQGRPDGLIVDAA